jgi:hypothetical protein
MGIGEAERTNLANHPYAPILRMTGPLEISSRLNRFLDITNKRAVHDFLYAEREVTMLSSEETNTGNAIYAGYTYAANLEPDKNILPYRRAFAMMINIYDIFRIYRPGITGERVGDRAIGKVLRFLDQADMQHVFLKVGIRDMTMVARNL